MRRLLTVCLAIVLSGPVAGPALANFELLLEDGSVLSGVDVRREEGQYLLETLEGQTVPIPEELVAEVRITAGVAPGVVKADPLQLAGDELRLDDDDEDRPATGVVKGSPQVLAGEEIRPARTSEQTKALGPPSEFTKDIIDPNWRPESVYNASNDVTNFAPSTWSDDIVDHSWKPESDYTQKSDVSNFAPSTFTESIIDNHWQPTDGFKKQGTSFQRDLSRIGRPSGRPLLAQATTPHFGQMMPASSVRRPGTARLGYAVSTSVSRPATNRSLTAMRASVAPTSRTSTRGGGGLPVSTCTWCPRFALSSSGTARRSVPREGPPTASLIRTCAEMLFDPLLTTRDEEQDELELSVRWIIDEAFARLPIDLYEGGLESGDEVAYRAVFTFSPRDCRLIAGDLTELTGRKFTDEQAVAFGLAAFNAAVATAQPARLWGSNSKIDYALGISALVIPGSTDVSLLTSTLELPDGSEDCTHSDRSRRKHARKIERKYEPPSVNSAAGGDVVTFYSWDSRGGEVRGHEVLVFDDGTVELESELLASHLGEHQCGVVE